MVRFGVIGTGRITEQMLVGATQHPKLRLTAVCSRSRERGEVFARQHGAACVFTDPPAMAQSDAVDMVHVAGPNACHTAHFQFYQLSSKYEALCRDERPNIFNPALHTGALMDPGVYGDPVLFQDRAGLRPQRDHRRSGHRDRGIDL